MHAVVGIWTLDAAQRDEQDRMLHEEIVPMVRSQPGFVSGYWMHDPESGKNHTAIIFNSREAAAGFKALVERGARRAAQAGVTSDILTTVEIVANAHHQRGNP